MSEEQLKAFWEAIQADTALQQKLQGVTDPDAVAVIAKEAGFRISADELKKAITLEQPELSDEQLEGFGGYCYNTNTDTIMTGRCRCHY